MTTANTSTQPPQDETSLTKEEQDLLELYSSLSTQMLLPYQKLAKMYLIAGICSILVITLALIGLLIPNEPHIDAASVISASVFTIFFSTIVVILCFYLRTKYLNLIQNTHIFQALNSTTPIISQYKPLPTQHNLTPSELGQLALYTMITEKQIKQSITISRVSCILFYTLITIALIPLAEQLHDILPFIPSWPHTTLYATIFAFGALSQWLIHRHTALTAKFIQAQNQQNITPKLSEPKQ